MFRSGQVELLESMASVGFAEDRREGQRRRVARAAVLMCTQTGASIPCVVLDICHSGAKLGLDASLLLPERFVLSIEREGIVAECRMGWRRGNAMGVAFLTQPAASSLKPA